METKQCPDCQNMVLLDDFKSYRRPDGSVYRYPNCRQCADKQSIYTPNKVKKRRNLKKLKDVRKAKRHCMECDEKILHEVPKLCIVCYARSWLSKRTYYLNKTYALSDAKDIQTSAILGLSNAYRFPDYRLRLIVPAAGLTVQNIQWFSGRGICHLNKTETISENEKILGRLDWVLKSENK